MNKESQSAFYWDTGKLRAPDCGCLVGQPRLSCNRTCYNKTVS